MNNIQKIKDKLNEIEKQFTELVQLAGINTSNNSKYRVKEGGIYYYISSSGDVANEIDSRYRIDDDRYDYGNYFIDIESAQIAANKLNTYLQLKRLANELNLKNPIDWNNLNQIKYCIICKSKSSSFALGQNTHPRLGTIYCTDSSFLQKAILRIGSYNIKELMSIE